MKDDLDERTTYVWNAVHVLERSLRVLEDQIHQTIAFREQRDAHAAKVAKALEECAAQENVSALQRVFSTYAEATQTLSTDTREVLVVRPEQQAIVELAQIKDWAVVPIKRLLDDRDKAIKTLKKLQKDVDDILQTNKERERRQRLVQDQKRRVENVNALLDLHMKRFEYFRVTKLKKVMSELARAQLYYHCKGVEYFSAPCRMVPLVDPQAASEDMGSDLYHCQQPKP